MFLFHGENIPQLLGKGKFFQFLGLVDPGLVAGDGVIFAVEVLLEHFDIIRRSLNKGPLNIRWKTGSLKYIMR